MPNRIIREAMNDSEAINRLSFRAEVFYRRLQLLVDDYGRHEAKPLLLRPKLFGLQLDRWSLEDVTEALRECVVTCRDNGTPLLRLYEHESRIYLEISEFRQQVRAKSKCPDPPNGNGNQVPGQYLLSKCIAADTQALNNGAAPAHLGVVVSVSESECVSERESAVAVSTLYGKTSGGIHAAAAAHSPPETEDSPEEPAFSPAVIALAEALVSELAEEHRKVRGPGNLRTAVRNCAARLAKARDAPALAGRYGLNHAASMRFWRAEKQRGVQPFIPNLDRWFHDGDCDCPPGEEACSPPVKPPTAAQAAEQERKRRISELLGAQAHAG